MKKVVCWDFDGTLVYSNHLWSNSVYKALKMADENTNVLFSDIRKEMAHAFTWNSPLEDYTQYTNNKWWAYINNNIYNSYINLGVDEKSAKLATSKVHSIIKEIKNYNIFDDTFFVLDSLKNMGVINVLLTNNYPDLYDVLDELNLTNYFDKIVISAQYGYDKPKIELFEIAKKNYENAEFFMVGDNPFADVLGGKNAGMKTILVHKEFDENADYCFSNLSDILSIFDE